VGLQQFDPSCPIAESNLVSFRPLKLSSEKPVSSLCFHKCNLYCATPRVTASFELTVRDGEFTFSFMLAIEDYKVSLVGTEMVLSASIKFSMDAEGGVFFEGEGKIVVRRCKLKSVVP
jgi:hypothetical protein